VVVAHLRHQPAPGRVPGLVDGTGRGDPQGDSPAGPGSKGPTRPGRRVTPGGRDRTQPSSPSHSGRGATDARLTSLGRSIHRQSVRAGLLETGGDRLMRYWIEKVPGRVRKGAALGARPVRRRQIPGDRATRIPATPARCCRVKSFRGKRTP